MDLYHAAPVVVILVALSAFSEGSQYSMYYTESLDWSDSHEKCLYKNRKFASINSLEDQESVQRLEPFMDSFFWIGLRLNGTTGQFEWADGSTPIWTNWAEGFPGTEASRGCVRIRPMDFAWETHDCTARLHFLCEDTTYRESLIVSLETKLKGVLLGLGIIGGTLILLCLLLQSPCCRHSVTDRIARIGFGTKDPDRKPIF